MILMNESRDTDSSFVSRSSNDILRVILYSDSILVRKKEC